MITRKENLLTQPFQHKKYIQHRMKVQTALPRIDDRSPAERKHVYLKCKKLQIEAERQNRIERENFILLRHLSDIMTAKRMDNLWIYKLPKFQSRVKLFHNRSSKVNSNNCNDQQQIEELTRKQPKRIKDNCIACNPSKFITPIKIPEERVPWDTKIEQEFRWSRNENKKHNAEELENVRRNQLKNRRKIRIQSAGCEYKSTLQHFHNRRESFTMRRKSPTTPADRSGKISSYADSATEREKFRTRIELQRIL